MNPYFNYIIDANSGLILFLLVYVMLLRKETDFRIKRVYMLFAIFTSLLFPLFHLETGTPGMLSIGKVAPAYWLPEIWIGTTSPEKTALWPSDAFPWLQIIYGAGVLMSLTLFIIRLLKLMYLISSVDTYSVGKLKIAESNENKPSFSFFSFVFLGHVQHLTKSEKTRIIEHEGTHARSLHSLDVLLINIVGIFFWFNPLIHFYKKIFIQLHEFEADASAVKNHEVDEYCNLLARVALMSADIKLANFFNHSLTVKRIEMMRTIKTRIKRWKIVALSAFVPLFFLLVCCQDEGTMSQTTTVPLDVEADMAILEKQFPGQTLTYFEGKDVIIQGKRLTEWQQSDELNKSILKTYKFKERGTIGVIVLLKDAYAEKSDHAVDGVHTVVEETASPVGGMNKLFEYIAANLLYPEEARMKGIEGKVFVEFVVQEDGKLTDFKVVKSVHPSVDAAAVRVLEDAPVWNPGTNSGVAVKQRMVLPIVFRLG